jgi:glutathione synthase/RimK-type ligase-like ATP-grasp enzyme
VLVGTGHARQEDPHGGGGQGADTLAGVEESSPSLPFPLLFQRRLTDRERSARPRFDVTAELAKLRPQVPNGRRDKVLIVAAGHDRHADAVALELVALGSPVCRLDVEAVSTTSLLTIRLDESRGPPTGRLYLPAGEVAVEEIQAVWFRRRVHEVFGIRPPVDDVANFAEREAQAALAGLWSLLASAFWIDRPDALYAADSKVHQLRVARECGFAIPRTVVTNDPRHAEDFIRGCVGGAVVKAFRGQLGDTLDVTRVIETRRLEPGDLTHLSLVRNAPCLFQEVVPKEADIRVTVIGQQIFAVAIRPTDDGPVPIDSRALDWRATTYEPIQLPAAVAARCRRMPDQWGLSFAAIDLILRPDGEYVFLELNTKGDWQWLEWATDLPITHALATLLHKGGNPDSQPA